MQNIENKRSESFLIAEFRDFFKREAYFRTLAFRSTFALAEPLCPATAFAFDCSSLLTSHSPLVSDSNRQTPELLETNVSCRKQREGVLSNRQCFALFPSHFARSRTAFLIGTQKHSRKTLIRTKHTTSQFLIGTEFRLLPSRPHLPELRYHGNRAASNTLLLKCRHDHLFRRENSAPRSGASPSSLRPPSISHGKSSTAAPSTFTPDNSSPSKSRVTAVRKTAPTLSLPRLATEKLSTSASIASKAATSPIIFAIFRPEPASASAARTVPSSFRRPSNRISFSSPRARASRP